MIPILEKIFLTTSWTQGHLAKRLGVTQPTVSRWLGGSEPELQHREKILGLAEQLGVVKKSSRKDDFTVPIVGYVGAGGEILYDEAQGPFDEAPAPPVDSGSNMVAVKVRGDSMAPQLEDGWLVYYDRRHHTPTEKLLGKLCVTALADGRVLIKKLLPGRAKGRYDLYSVNAAPMLDQLIAWVALVTWIAPG